MNVLHLVLSVWSGGMATSHVIPSRCRLLSIELPPHCGHNSLVILMDAGVADGGAVLSLNHPNSGVGLMPMQEKGKAITHD